MNRFLILFLLSGSLQAQVRLQLLDDISGNPIVGAQVNFINDSGNVLKISDDQGVIITATDLPVKIQISHISYQDQQISLTHQSQVIRLTPTVLALEEVVVTGQYAPQSARNSVYKVRTINADRIEKQGANTLQDILVNELNMRFDRDNALGSSNLSIQGISGQNVKVLIDGVPVVGRGGVSNEIDINQINVNTIERIEIVEGPMAVNFGADALAGVINIITKKGNDQKFTANVTLQEETIEDNYTLFDEGIHNAAISLNGKVSDKLFAQVEGRVNKFGGWVGDESNFDDRNRQWYPKQQHFLGGLLRYSREKFSIHYRVDFLDESINNLGPINALDPTSEPSSSDQDYVTKRWMHQVQGEIELGKWSLNPVLSYTDYDRITESYTTFLTSNLETNRVQSQSTLFNTFFFRNTASLSPLKWGSLQLGVESTIDKGGGSRLSDGDKFMEDVAVFASAEIKLNSNLAIRPGLRHSYNSVYETSPTPSLNVKYDLNPSTQVRMGYGRGFRVPSLRELYHEFIDNNHNIIGNPELKPEFSHNLNVDISKEFKSINLQSSIGGFYNDIEDRISFFTPEQSNAATTYLNIAEFKSLGGTFNSSWHYKTLKASAGFAYIGRYQRLTDVEADLPSFVFNWEFNSNISYRIKKSNTTLSAFYKFNGPQEDYFLVNPENGGDPFPELQGTEGFHMLDISVNQKIANSLNLTVGARNLFNVTAVDNNFSSGGAHGGTTGTTSVGYGTSFFLRINYQLNIK